MIMAVRIEKALKTLYFTNSTDKEWIAQSFNITYPGRRENRFLVVFLCPQPQGLSLCGFFVPMFKDLTTCLSN